MSRPITFKPSLSADDLRSNLDNLTALFLKSNFTNLLTAEYDRDGDKDLEFAEVMAANAAALHIHASKITVENKNHIEVLAAALNSAGMVINETILQNNDEAFEQRKALSQYFRNLLCIEAFERDAAIIAASNIDEKYKRQAAEKSARVIASRHADIKAYYHKIEIEQRLLKVKAPGNGDCFYHATMLDIIHDVITDKIPENSITATHIKQRLLPTIANKMHAVGGPKLDFTHQTLKESIMTLLKAAPTNALPALALEVKTSDSTDVAAIKQCALPQLLRDVCAPALRQVMLSGASHENVQHAVYEVLQREFSAFIKKHYGAKLNLDADEISAGINQFDNGEFHGIPVELSQHMLDSWHQVYKEYNGEISNDINEFINVLFAEWWKSNKASAIGEYFQFHTLPTIMASRPQQLALAQELHCHFVNVNRTTAALDPLSTPIDGAHALLLSNSGMHFDSMVGNPESQAEPSAVAKALQERMVTTPQQATLNYPWPKLISDIEAAASSEIKHKQAKPVISLDVVQASIKTTQKAIMAHDVISDTSSLKPFEADILQAAKTGYQEAMKHTVFGSTPRDAKAQQEADDLLHAIQLQNDEIHAYLSSKNRK